MNNKLRIMASIPKYRSFKTFGYPKMLPFNLTVSLTYHCNSRCKTCNVWKKKVDELKFDEFDKIFKNIGDQPYGVVLSGGEPFLRKDIVNICQSIYKNCKPMVINIPTNGILYDRIPRDVQEIVESCPDTQIIINLSLDGIKEKHDEIRNVLNNYEKAIKTYEGLKQIKSQNLELGIHTVISKFNVKEIPDIYKYFVELEPDSYITEIAEERVELDTIGTDITPDIEDYSKAVDFLSGEMQKWNPSGISRMTKYFRLQYYDIVKKTLREKRQIIPCYAGHASGQISPNGDVWICCTKAESIGNLRDNDYDLKKIWFNKKADEMRESVKNGRCYCTLANASYTNMLCNLGILTNVALKMVI